MLGAGGMKREGREMDLGFLGGLLLECDSADVPSIHTVPDHEHLISFSNYQLSIT